MRSLCAVVLVALVALGPLPRARAATPPGGTANGASQVRLSLYDGASLAPWARPSPSSAPAPGRRTHFGWLGGLGAIVPGVLVHGSGHFVAGDTRTGLKLLAMEGLGLLGIAAGGVPIYLSGASRRIIGPAYALALSGGSLFLISWFADLYGAISGGHGLGEARRVLVPLEMSAGLAYVYDPQFAYRLFAVMSADLRLKGVRLSPSTWIAMGTDHQRLRLEGAYRLFGPCTAACPIAGGGSFLDLVVGGTYRHFGPEGFKVLTAEVSFLARYDLRALSSSLAGSFAELGLGVGLEWYGYRGRGFGDDVEGLLLMRLGYGLYLGHAPGRCGEVMLYYDHRHDDFAGGASFGLTVDGMPGHVGLSGYYYLTERWGLGADFVIGSAVVAQLTARYQWRR